MSELPSVSGREEIANSISHGLGLVLALVALPILLLSAIRIGSTQFIVGAVVFGGTMVLLYLASTLYHSVTHETAKQFFLSSTIARSSCSSPAPTHPLHSVCCGARWAGRCSRSSGSSPSPASSSRRCHVHVTRGSRWSCTS